MLTPGRRYTLFLQAYDTTGGLPGANIRPSIFRPFSVAGPTISLFVNQGDFHGGQTQRLGASVRNDGPPLKVTVEIWAGAPEGSIVELLAVADVDVPSTPRDVSTAFSDIFTYTFSGAEPAGPYVLGIRAREETSSAIVAQSMVGFTFAP